MTEAPRSYPWFASPISMRLAALSLLLGVSACVWSPPRDAHRTSEKIAEQVARGDGTTIDLAETAPFEWTRFCAFPPYTTEAVAERTLGFPWTYRWSAVKDLDDRTFLVFVNDETVVAAFDYFSIQGDFNALSEPFCVDRAEARLVVREMGRHTDGSPYLVIGPAPDP